MLAIYAYAHRLVRYMSVTLTDGHPVQLDDELVVDEIAGIRTDFKALLYRFKSFFEMVVQFSPIGFDYSSIINSMEQVSAMLAF
jgi:hypothetical protein